MLLGLVLTDWGIFLGWEKVVANLCSLWLGAISIGYLGTGFAVRSRAFSSKFLSPVWDFNFTLHRRAVMVFSLLVLAELQWDMRHPINYAALTTE